MFIISSTYTRPPLDNRDLLAEHKVFVEAGYTDGHFVASGPRASFSGGVIIARGTSEVELRSLMSKDPFIREGVVNDYDYLAFRSTMASHTDLIEP